ncbi:hypothetical protein ACJVDH_12585 [Pedobacter sp. AW1-32]|uniref:hypothetical protein n=1 Tax=Pedobacter sp. AW1-32 TaxID=3383026 RepID=UPI003FF00244
MTIPLYIYFEILSRLSEYIPSIGDYHSVQVAVTYSRIVTTTGQIVVPVEMLSRQFNDPTTISRKDIVDLSSTFQPGIEKLQRIAV